MPCLGDRARPCRPRVSAPREKIRNMADPTGVYLEVGSKRVFAGALDWPGWCRSGRTAEDALETLASYHPRYAVVAKRAGLAFPRRLADDFAVVEEIAGTGTTDFGAPDKVAGRHRTPLSAAEAKREVKLLRATWAVFDDVVAGSPAELRKGPRGGGRDRDKMVGHVLESEASYARSIGVKLKPPAIDDRAAIEELRDAIAEVLGQPSTGQVERGWPPRYAAARIAWHVLDHAWEMQDKAT